MFFSLSGTLDAPLSETIQHALKASRNIESLYVHQASAINALAQGTHVIVSTSTASGKSVIYQVKMIIYNSLLCLKLKLGPHVEVSGGRPEFDCYLRIPNKGLFYFDKPFLSFNTVC